MNTTSRYKHITLITTAEVEVRGQSVELNLKLPVNTDKITGINVYTTKNDNAMPVLRRYYSVLNPDVEITPTVIVEGFDNETIVHRERTITYTTTLTDNYLYYVQPKSWGPANFKIEGIDGGFNNPFEVEITDAETGYTEKYLVYRSIGNFEPTESNPTRDVTVYIY